MARTDEQRRKAAEYQRQWNKDNPKKLAAIQKKYRDKNREKVRARRLTPEQKERKKTYRTKARCKKYGLTTDQYEQILEDQANVCAVCTKSFGKTPHIDHDHETGAVRGILCHHCNTALGLLKDSPELLLRAVMYLRRKR